MSQELVAGTEIASRFHLRRLVGEGGMGSVWQADDLQGGGVVALKFVKEATASAKLRRRLLREAKAACTVSHPCVVEVHDILELEDGSPVMVMEFLEGESLAARLERLEAMSLEELAPIMQQVVSAVGTAHALGVVHRDLKPENIFLSPREGDAVEVKILDFGIAKLAPSQFEATHSTELTKTGALVGTPCYMAPEQVYGEKDVDCRADVWALGLIMYRALSGILPTQADNVGQVMKIITTRGIWPLAQATPDLPEDITTLVDRMLSHERDRRPASLHEVREVLARYTEVETPPFSVPEIAPSARELEPESGRHSSDSARHSFQIHTHADPLSVTSPSAAHSADRRPRRVALLVGLAVVALAGVGWWAIRSPEAPTEDRQVSSPPVESPASSASPPVTEAPPRAEPAAPPEPSSHPVERAAAKARAPAPIARPKSKPASSAEPVASGAPPSEAVPENCLGDGRVCVDAPF